MDKIKILVFPAEAENAFEIYDSLCFSTRFEVWGASNKQGISQLIFGEKYHFLPNITNNNFLKEINNFIKKNNISFIIPTHDDVALFLAKNKEYIFCKIIGSTEITAQLCREKKSLYKAISKEDFCPKFFNSPNEIDTWPVFLKPNKGQGSNNTHIVKNNNILKELLINLEDYVICEYLPGEEFTVDCFTDRNKNLIFIGPRTREKIKIGISFLSRTFQTDDAITSIAKKLNQIITPHGLWFFQVKKDKNGFLKVMETSCRASTGIGVYRNKGVNLPLLAAYDAIGMDVKPLENKNETIMHRRIVCKYQQNIKFEKIYIDYDDTIIINNKVNVKSIEFIYKMKNINKDIILITKHQGNLKQHMHNFCIPENLFSEIIQIKSNEKKSNFIKYKYSIFVDNLFSERMDVSKNNGIPVYDVDGLDYFL